MIVFLRVLLVWIAHREQSWPRRVLWFVLLMGLGNIAIAGHLLWAPFRLPADAPLERLLLRPGASD